MPQDTSSNSTDTLARRMALAPGGTLHYRAAITGEVLTVIAGSGTIHPEGDAAARLEPGRPILLEATSLHRLDAGLDGLTVEVCETPPRCGCC
jgi:quercetin dioxygenase-like cupin family protein